MRTPKTLGKKAYKLEWYGDDLVAAVKQYQEPALWEAGQALKRESMARAPSRSGMLRKSAYVATNKRNDYVKHSRDRRKVPVPRMEGIAVVGYGVHYANLLEDSGAKPHPIPRLRRRPAASSRRRKVMLIPGIGWRSRVNHPGMRRKAFLGPAMTAMQGKLGRIVADKLGDGIERELPHGQ